MIRHPKPLPKIACPRCGTARHRSRPQLSHTPQLDAEGRPACSHVLWHTVTCWACGTVDAVERILPLHPYCRRLRG
jgi:endogenous inhibitor of DNA gyrase (YacG/DUF329 family)